MEQRLVFEKAWDKTIAPLDREKIEQLFQDENFQQNEITFTPIKQDQNYKGEYLIMVLVHNRTNETLSFDNRIVSYRQKSGSGDYLFHYPSLVLEPYTSTPWTFIFPSDFRINLTEEIHLSV